MSIQDNLNEIKQQIKDIADNCNRNPEDVNLIAVSKRQEINNIKQALSTGHLKFGENQIQEAGLKWLELKKDYNNVTLHMIGHLQSNKVKEAVALFDVIETLDSEKLAKALAKEQIKQDKELEYFIQVNTGEEDQKYGIKVKELDDFLSFCQNEQKLNITGLMSIPPESDLSSYHFALLSKLAKRCKLDRISMGMSGDFEQAILFGSTNIRLGTSIFGKRDKV